VHSMLLVEAVPMIITYIPLIPSLGAKTHVFLTSKTAKNFLKKISWMGFLHGWYCTIFQLGNQILATPIAGILSIEHGADASLHQPWNP
jgi:hypothetical protein